MVLVRKKWSWLEKSGHFLEKIGLDVLWRTGRIVGGLEDLRNRVPHLGAGYRHWEVFPSFGFGLGSGERIQRLKLCPIRNMKLSLFSKYFRNDFFFHGMAAGTKKAL